jgi:hypothetical protein
MDNRQRRFSSLVAAVSSKLPSVLHVASGASSPAELSIEEDGKEEEERELKAYLEGQRREYLDERKQLTEYEWKGGESYVRLVATLSGGAFGLSLAFVEKLAPHPSQQTAWYILVAWVAFIASLILILAAHLTSQHSMRVERSARDSDWDYLDAKYNRKVQPPADAPAPPGNPWSPGTSWLNGSALVAFVVGAVFLAMFTWSNLPVS